MPEKGTVAKNIQRGESMEEIKVIGLCNYCGEKKEVIPTEDNRMICAECLIEYHDRIDGHFLPGTNRENVKDNRLCQQPVFAATEN